MPRIARLVVPDVPHQVTQRGNRRGPIFFAPGDQQIYLGHLTEECRRRGVGIWAYCLMPNHVHLILTPSDQDGLRLAIGEAHRRYTNVINRRFDWTGHLFQNRFASVPMDDSHFLTAVRYVSLNPVRAGLVRRPEHWRWSSVRAHLEGRPDGVVDVGPVLLAAPDFEDLIEQDPDDSAYAPLRAAEASGRPLGDSAFVRMLEERLGRPVMRRKGDTIPGGIMSPSNRLGP
ncbi:MAG TPA: transposase [Caulobacteraceae bacterium]|nr:transposase [Caulobacteraceae bacterium]